MSKWIHKIFATVLIASAPLASAAESQPTWSARLSYWNDAAYLDDMPLAAGDVETLSRKEFYFAYSRRAGEAKGFTRFSYAHQPVLVRRGVPAHNGYFHQLDIEAVRVVGAITLGAKLGVHGSSNMFKHRDFHDEALVGSFALRRPLTETVGIGIHGDYRFGGFHAYPVLDLDLPLGDGRLRGQLPVALHWFSAGERWRLGIERYGEKWAALDREREVESAFYLSEWRLAAHYRQTSPANGAVWELSAGISVDTELRQRDLTRGRHKEDMENAVFLALGLHFY